jgi:hypothetical protein
MLKILQDFLVRRDVNGAATQLEKAAREAYGP